MFFGIVIERPPEQGGYELWLEREKEKRKDDFSQLCEDAAVEVECACSNWPNPHRSESHLTPARLVWDANIV